MEGLTTSQPTPEETIDANPLVTYQPLSHEEIHDISEILRKLIAQEGQKLESMSGAEKIVYKENLIKKFIAEKEFTPNMSEDEFVDFIRNCAEGSPNFILLQQNPHIVYALQTKLLPLFPKI